MYCKYCGVENKKNAKFCEKCGKALEADEEESLLSRPIVESVKKSNHIFQEKKWYFLGLAVGICLAVAVSVLLIVLNNPMHKMKSLLKDGKLNEAYEIFNEERVNMTQEEKAEITDILTELIENEKTNVQQNPESAQEAYELFDSIDSWMIGSLDASLRDGRKYVKALEESHAHFLKAEKLFEAKDYIGAMAEYRLVQADYPQYTKASSQRAKAHTAYRDEVIRAAEEKMESNDFFGAFDLLDKGKENMPDERMFEEKQKQYQQTYVEKLISEAEALAKKSKYEEALSQLKSAIEKLSDDSLSAAYSEICKSYVEVIRTKVSKYAAEEDLFSILDCLNRALEYAPDDEDIQNLLNTYEWDDVLYEDATYIIVRKNYENYDNYTICVGLWNKKEKTWVAPLSSDFIFATAIQEQEGKGTYMGGTTEFNSDNLAYLGEGVFIATLGVDIINTSGQTTKVGSYSSLGDSGLDIYLYNAWTNTSSRFNATDISYCSNGYMLMYNSARYNSAFYSVSANGDVTALPVAHSVAYDGPSYSGYSNGVFFANGYFYDIDGNEKIDLTQYDLISTPYFENEKCTIVFKNAACTEYEAVIDLSGNFITAPYAK